MQNADRMANLMNHLEPPHRLRGDDFDDNGFGAIFGRRVAG